MEKVIQAKIVLVERFYEVILRFSAPVVTRRRKKKKSYCGDVFFVYITETSQHLSVC